MTAERTWLALARHGQTDWNLAERLQGRTDIPLNEAGHAQARELADRLAAEPVRWDAILTSPLARAADTAACVAERVESGAPVSEPLLVERSFGEAEGMSASQAWERWPDRDYPGMETYAASERRARSLLDRIAADRSGQRVIAVSHGSFIRHLLAEVSGVPTTALPRVNNVEVCRLVCSEDGAWRIDSIANQPWELICAAREL